MVEMHLTPSEIALMLQEKWHIEDVTVTGQGSPRWQHAFKGCAINGGFFAGEKNLRIFSCTWILRPQKDTRIGQAKPLNRGDCPSSW